MLNGSINPGGAATTYHFEWGLTTAYGVSSKVETLASGTTSVAVKATVTGLLPGTTYHYRIDASNASGTVVGADRTFKTLGTSPPGVSTGPGATLGPFSATVTGLVNPAGANTTWYVQYGLTSAYTVQTLGGTVPIGTTTVTVSQTLTGLQPGVTFHYRFVAVHNGRRRNTVRTRPSPRSRGQRRHPE